MAGFMDFCIGAYIAQVLLYINEVPWAWWPIFVGGFLALLPDMDIAFQILRGRVVGNHRESLMHMPLLIIPSAVVAAWIVGGNLWALIAFLCVLWHYLHDTLEGIKWFSPFFSQSFFCYRGRVPLEAGNHASFVQKVWLVPNPRTLIEWSFGCGALYGAFPLTPTGPGQVNFFMLALLFVPFVVWGAYWLYNKKPAPQ